LHIKAKHNPFCLVFAIFCKTIKWKFCLFSLQTFHFSMKRKNKRTILLLFASNFFSFRFVSLPIFLFLFHLPCIV
jgi:hypothetical protein